MDAQRIGFLHPGNMGVSLAATARNSGHTACWVSAGRSAETRERAEEQGLVEMETLDELCCTCSTIVSVCPPPTRRRVANVTAKAWRFAGEMEEISATFASTGIPGGFHAAASDLYRRIAGFKGAAETPAVEDVLRALLDRVEDGGQSTVV